MGGYSKNIAVIRGLKSGFSANGGELSGLVKAEKYGSRLKVEASLINFAPLTEGRYVTAVSDGKHICILDGTLFEGVSEVDTSSGFAALVCYVNTSVSPIATAVCGNFSSAAIGIREEIEKQEMTALKQEKKNTESAKVKSDCAAEKSESRAESKGVEESENSAEANGQKAYSAEATVYEDEALAEENYYEYEQADESGGSVCEDTQKEEVGRFLSENEAAVGAVEGGETGIDDIPVPLSHGMCFYERMRGEIEGVLSEFPEEKRLERVVENSRWVRITYGDGKYYVFGVIYGGGVPQYICYGVPTTNSKRPPESLEGLAGFIPSEPDGDGDGFWVMYQDAATGASIKTTFR